MVVPTINVLIAAFQVPLIPLVDVVGNTGATEFWHNCPIAVKVGVINGLTVIFNVVVVAHNPAVGVNVYVVVPAVAVLTAGAQVPVMPFVEVVGNTGFGSF